MIKHTLLFFAFCLILFSCKKEESPSPITNDLILGTWQMKTSRVVVKANVNGKEETADQTRNGTTVNTLTIKSDGTIADPSDLFGTSTYSWNYSINGTELKLFKSSNNLAYFTISVNTAGMQWNMNTEQTKRSLSETTGKNSVINANSSIKDLILENNFTIEFIKK